MKKYFILIFLFCSFLFAEVIDIKTLSEVSDDINQYELIIFDIDNTIVEPLQLFGSDEWFYYTLSKYQKEGFDYKKALDKTLFDWYEIQSVTKVKFVEDKMKVFIQNLQDKKIKLIGLTTRGSDLAFSSIKQLDSLNVDLSQTSPYNQKLFFENGIIYKKGILFADGKNKGEVLNCFFKKVGFFPKSIVFFDDKLKHVLEVENFCKSNNIKFMGYRYGFLDEKVKNFNYEICRIEQQNFIHVLSDEEALKLLEK